MAEDLKQNIERFESHKLKTEPRRFLEIREPNQQALYDTIFLDHRIGRWQAFQMPLGTSDRGRLKTLQHTNMYSSGCLPSPWAFYFKSLSAVFVKDDRVLPVRSEWYYGTTVALSINSKIYLENHLNRLADRCALFVDDEERRDAVTRGIWKLLEPLPWTPMLINSLEPFKVQCEFSESLDWENAPDELVIYLDGVVFRGIQ